MHSRPRSHTYRCIQARVAAVLLALAACVTGLLCVSAPALAEFSRPYIGQLTGAPTGPNGSEAPFDLRGGLTVDPSSGDVYVSGELNLNYFVDEFNSSGVFIEQLMGLSGFGSLAFDDANGKLESAAGSIGEAREYVAADDSTSGSDKARGDVYVTSVRREETNFFEHRGFVQRVDMSGARAPFTCLENGKTPEYINGAGELTGKPGETWGENGPNELMAGIAVDSGSATIPSAGDIYVAIQTNVGGGPKNDPGLVVIASHVDEFTSEGCFVREFTGAMVPETVNNGEYVFDGTNVRD